MTTPSCKFKVGDAVVFSHERYCDGKQIRGVVEDVDFKFKFPVSVELEDGAGLQCFTADGRFNLSEEPSLSLATEIVPCKFKVGDAVVFEWEKLNEGKPLKGKVADIDFNSKYPVSVEFAGDFNLLCFKTDGRFLTSEQPALRLASEKPTWTVILLYPDYMTDDYGADIYVDSTEADDPYEAVKLVQQEVASMHSDDIQERNPDDFRCIGVIKGEHDFVLDATNF